MGTLETRETHTIIQPVYTFSRLDVQVLNYLIHNQERIVTADELLREIWKTDRQSGGTINQVRCCIKRLRRKLRASGQNNYQIQTVNRCGYRLITREMKLQSTAASDK